MSIGKKTAKTGIKIVPGPKPEKNVRRAVKNAAKQITYNFHIAIIMS